jgi:uncharacterized membrane protein YhaH (DUF805 family)
MSNNLVACYINAWRHYFDFSGNTSRREYWLCMLTHLCVSLLLISFDIWSSSLWQSNLGWLDLCYSLISFIPMIAITTRRLHDSGRSGWWVLVFIIPAIGPFWLIYLLSQRKDGVDYEERSPC